MLVILNCFYIIFICYLMLIFTLAFVAICRKLEINDDEYDPIKILKQIIKKRKESKNEKN